MGWWRWKLRRIVPIALGRAEQLAAYVVIDSSQRPQAGYFVTGGPQGDLLGNNVDLRGTEGIPPKRKEFRSCRG